MTRATMIVHRVFLYDTTALCTLGRPDRQTQTADRGLCTGLDYDVFRIRSRTHESGHVRLRACFCKFFFYKMTL
jgi:hypothetical protein